MAFRAVIIAAAIAMWASSAQALACFDPAGYQNFNAQYGEAPVARATLGSVGKMLLVANPKTGTWTMIIVRDDMLMCPFASGNNFKLVKPKGEKIKWTPNL